MKSATDFFFLREHRLNQNVGKVSFGCIICFIILRDTITIETRKVGHTYIPKRDKNKSTRKQTFLKSDPLQRALFQSRELKKLL